MLAVALIPRAVATVMRDFRAYGTVLADYSVAIISISNIDAPASTFVAAVDRVAAILTPPRSRRLPTPA